jgi:hypothetical protein
VGEDERIGSPSASWNCSELADIADKADLRGPGGRLRGCESLSY